MTRRSLPILMSLLASLLVPMSAAAQQRLFALTAGSLVEIDSAPARLGNVLASTAVPPASEVGAPTQMLTAGAGRYVVWATTWGYLLAADTTTGEVRILSGIHSVSTDPSPLLGTDRSGNELIYVATEDIGELAYHRSIAIRNLTSGDVRRVALPEPGQSAIFAYASEANRVFFGRAENDVPHLASSMLVGSLDLSSGDIQQALFAIPSVSTIATNASGTLLWAARRNAFEPSGYAAFDTGSGALAAFNSLLPNQAGAPLVTLLPDAPRNLLLTVTDQGLAALDGTTLQRLGTANAPTFDLSSAQIPGGWDPWFTYQVLAAPTANAIYTLDLEGVRESYQESRCVQGSLIALSPVNGTRLATKNFSGCPAILLAMSSAPTAPANVAATTDGGHVAITWSAPAQALGYQVEAGTAPGLTNLARVDADTPSFTADNVPPGTYYVRVRAVNHAGIGPASEELVVQIQ